ncbi:MAG: cobalamin biosynthesis protein [Methanocellales archaeon]|nr:cobalamin biosynthesis protein [Methanocellales archaeon]MDD3421313.1 cobalamin biosynthesis protein [Methanocellales archaeon]MDD4898583.1 cobalamin biosynthesis protein [Methanocellales archaeon]MDD5446936.1 cobalamin biosynthesis protein [Methanocellales archaeon]
MIWKILLIAILIDLIFGEPPEKIHPVVWMGKLIAGLRAHMNKSKIGGVIVALIVVGGFTLAGYLISLISGIVGLIISAYILKATFSITCLAGTANMMEKYLASDDLKNAKKNLPKLVGRDPAQLSKKEINSAVIESVAENFVDGIFSPLFYFLLFGIPGALAYKAINTLDSMAGQGDFGYFSAKLDDLVNYIPARLSVLFISAGAIFYGSPLSALKISRRDHGLTKSPNSGWPMAAMAGSLAVSLKKPDHYILGSELDMPESYHIKRAVRIMEIATTFLIIVSFTIAYFVYLPLY